MKTVFIPYNQAYTDRILDIFDKLTIRGFTLWESVQGRGTKKGEPHYGNHAWPTMNSAFVIILEDEKVDKLLEALRVLDLKNEELGLHAYVWNVEKML